MGGIVKKSYMTNDVIFVTSFVINVTGLSYAVTLTDPVSVPSVNFLFF